MQINWLTYDLNDAVINYRQWHIKLDSYDQDWNIVNTYPITYSKQEEIEEIKEIVLETEERIELILKELANNPTASHDLHLAGYDGYKKIFDLFPQINSNEKAP